MAPRSRTGCLTCRQRKLKCSEEHPVCAQCTKADRTCVPSSGITFRHQQNPSMNGVTSGEQSLGRFYGYRESFTKGTTWVDVPQDLTFIHVHNPFDDDGVIPERTSESRSLIQKGTPQETSESHIIDATLASGLASLAQAGYNAAYATLGLEALSTVASQDYHYARSPDSFPIETSISLPQTMSEVSQNDLQISSQYDHTPDANNIASLSVSRENMIDSGESRTNNIDPRLHDTVSDGTIRQEHIVDSVSTE